MKSRLSPVETQKKFWTSHLPWPSLPWWCSAWARTWSVATGQWETGPPGSHRPKRQRTTWPLADGPRISDGFFRVVPSDWSVQNIWGLMFLKDSLKIMRWDFFEMYGLNRWYWKQHLKMNWANHNISCVTPSRWERNHIGILYRDDGAGMVKLHLSLIHPQKLIIFGCWWFSI